MRPSYPRSPLITYYLIIPFQKLLNNYYIFYNNLTINKNKNIKKINNFSKILNNPSHTSSKSKNSSSNQNHLNLIKLFNHKNSNIFFSSLLFSF